MPKMIYIRHIRHGKTVSVYRTRCKGISKGQVIRFDYVHPA